MAWTHAELLAAEKGAVGFYITGHPLENYSLVLKELGAALSLDLCGLESGSRVNIGGIATALQVRTTKKGSRFGLMRLEDQAGGVKCVLWPEIFAKYEALLQNDLAVLITGKVEVSDDGSASVICEEVSRLDDILQRNIGDQ
jgi:DNA polymerase-3 subunit alpha